MTDDGNWDRLAELLVARRIELGYPKRLPFAKKHGWSHDRVLSDMEHARRQNFDDATLARVEQTYRWAPGSVRRVLAGGSPHGVDEPIGVAAGGQHAGVMLEVPDEALAGLSEIDREEVLAAARLALLQKAREIRNR